MGFPVSEAYSLPVNAKSLVGSVMANLCGSYYPLLSTTLARMSHHSHRLLMKILGTVPGEQRDNLSEIWGEELLSLEVRTRVTSRDRAGSGSR